MKKQAIGALGEDAAVNMYTENGYDVIDRNYRTRHGEIDIILRRGEMWVFAEVKTRKENAVVSAYEAVDIHKQQKIMKTAQIYMMKNSLGEPFMRFDVAEVIWSEDKSPKVTILENAFSL